jgi:hypothetical protein
MDFPVKSGVENANYSPAFSDFSTFFADSCTVLSAKYTPMVQAPCATDSTFWSKNQNTAAGQLAIYKQ